MLPVLAKVLADRADVVTLVKQFEVGKENVGKGGIIREPAERERVVAEIAAFSVELGFRVMGQDVSPITGAKGNVEFLLAAA